jgi:sarcosine oxidase
MADRADIAVIGAGIVGLSTAFALTEQGASVAIYERGVPGNAQSGGESRIFRHAHDDRRMVALAREARGVWREWEERFGQQLLSRDGVISIGSAVDRRLAILLEAGGVRAGRIGSSELADALPLLAAWDGPAMLDEDGGVIRARAAIAALTGVLAATIVAEEVVALRVTSRGSVEVRTGGATVEHERAVLGSRCPCARRSTPGSRIDCAAMRPSGCPACSPAMARSASRPTRTRCPATRRTPWAWATS